MKITNLSAEIAHEGDDVTIKFTVPIASFISFIDHLKKNKPVKAKISIPSNPAAIKERIIQAKNKFFNDVKSYKEANPGKYPSEFYNEFIDTWTEVSPAGKKMRFEDEIHFEIGKRLARKRKFIKLDRLNEMWAKDKGSEPGTLFKS